MQRVGDYTIVRELGRGGAGAVFLGQGPGGESVAVKVHAGQLHNPRAEARFSREVQAMRRLDHPGIVRVHDAGVVGGRPYFVMELVDGASLGDRLRAEGVLEPEEARRLVQQLAEAIEHAHRVGVLHRDLKPDNVLLDASGRAWVTDFGLSREVDPRATRLTHTGAFVGTPGFWAPEQALGDRDRTGPASDVYGLGAILYTCLVGQPPRPSELSVEAVSRPIVPPHRAQPLVPPWLSRVCMRCLEDDPQARYPSAAALVDALAGPRATRARGGALPLAAAALGGFALALGLVVALGVGRGEPQVASPPPAPSAPTPAQGPVAEVPAEDDTYERARALLDEPGGARQAKALLADAVAAGSTDPRVWALRGSLASDDQEWAAASAAMERALELDDRQAQVWLSLSHVRRKLGLPEAALEAVQRCLDLAPRTPTAHYNRGVILSSLGRAEEAVLAYTAAVELDPRDTDALANRGVALLGLGRTEEAFESYDRALRQGGESMIAREGRGVALLRMGRPVEAVSDLDYVVQRDLEAPASTWANHGVALAQLGRLEEARRSLERACRFGSPDLGSLTNLGLVCRDLGDVDAARAAFERALAAARAPAQRAEVQGYLDALPR